MTRNQRNSKKRLYGLLCGFAAAQESGSADAHTHQKRDVAGFGNSSDALEYLASDAGDGGKAGCCAVVVGHIDNAVGKGEAGAEHKRGRAIRHIQAETRRSIRAVKSGEDKPSATNAARSSAAADKRALEDVDDSSGSTGEHAIAACASIASIARKKPGASDAARPACAPGERAAQDAVTAACNGDPYASIAARAAVKSDYSERTRVARAARAARAARERAGIGLIRAHSDVEAIGSGASRRA